MSEMFKKGATEKAKEPEMIAVTQEEGQALMVIAERFFLQERLGESKFSTADRAQAESEVCLHLRRELKRHSPLCRPPERRVLFGPEENFSPQYKDGQIVDYIIVDTQIEVDLVLHEEALAGAYWCLLVALHPDSQHHKIAGVQGDVLWPLAAKLRVVKELRKEIKLHDAKPRRIKRDEVPAEGEMVDL